MNENIEWRPTYEPQPRPSLWVRIKSLVWAWLKTQQRVKAIDDQWRQSL